jgi:hypothetical protein
MGVAHTALKQHSDDYCLKFLRQVELDRAGWANVAKPCRSAAISHAKHYTSRKRFMQHVKAAPLGAEGT